MRKGHPKRRKYSEIMVKEAMQLIPAERILPWQLNAPSRPPSDFLIEDLRRLKSFGSVSFRLAAPIYAAIRISICGSLGKVLP